MSVIFDALTGQIINLSSVSGGVTPPASTTPEIRPHFFSTVNNSTLDDNSDVVWFDTSLGNFSVFLPLNPQQNQILKLVGIANGPGLVTLNVAS